MARLASAVVIVANRIEWEIPLIIFACANMGKVEKIHIDIGGRTSPAESGTGCMDIDDIGLLKP